MPLPVSIVIPTFNRATLLVEFLPSYLAEDCSEVIVVDDSSSPPVESALSRLPPGISGRCPIRVIRNTSRLQQPASRMVGVRAASQPYIFFGEDDAFLTPGHIHALFHYVSKGEADIVASYWPSTVSAQPDLSVLSRMPEASSPGDFVNLVDITMRTDHRITRPIPVFFLHTLALMPRDLVLRVGFDPQYKGNAFREETDFYLRAFHEGARLALVPAPPAFHYKGARNSGGGQRGGMTLRSFIWYEYWVVRNNYYFLKKNAPILDGIVGRRRPLAQTVRYMLRRSLGYPGRLRAEVRRRWGA